MIGRNGSLGKVGVVELGIIGREGGFVNKAGLGILLV